MDGHVQEEQTEEDVLEQPAWKLKYQKIYDRLFGWWEMGVPPTWLVIVGCLVVQVHSSLYNFFV